jgi:hypothetical protein
VKEAIPPNAFPLRGCWSMYVYWLWPCWWQAYVTIAYGILHISKYGWHWLFGIWRSNTQAKLAYLVLSLLLWSKAWRHCEAYDTNYEWWKFKSMDHPIFMVIICLWYITLNDLNQHWRSYQVVCKSVAMGESLTGHICKHDNPADICTKIIPSGWNETWSLGWSKFILS